MGFEGKRNIVVTTSRGGKGGPPARLIELASKVAEELGGVYIPRKSVSIGEDPETYYIVVREDKIICRHRGSEFFWHPSTAKIRIGDPWRDPMVEAMGLMEGDWVLDCTLGKGSDAIVISYVVGERGRVVGVEIVPIIAYLVRIGLRTYEDENGKLVEAMRRIEVVNADHREYLASLEDKSFDIVYFDPFFPVPIKGATHMEPLRALGFKGDVDEETIEEALRVSRRRVVMKRRADEIPPPWVKEVVRGSRSSIAFWIIK
jgi:hypothetical protein